MNCQLIAMALARIDTELYQIYKVQGWRVARRDSRTICCRYGELTYTRRLLQKEGKSFYPLDCKMGFESRKHYSLGMIERIVESVAITTSRSASESCKAWRELPSPISLLSHSRTMPARRRRLMKKHWQKRKRLKSQYSRKL